MNSFWLDGLALLTAKAALIGASAVMAIAGVLLDLRKHTLASAILAVIIGTLVGVIAASSIIPMMNWPQESGYGISAVFGISGNNLAKSLLRASANPLSSWNKWRGKK